MIDPLVRELLSWLSERPRTYQETMQAWRSNCPRHPVWEDACIDGFVEVIGDQVALTAQGKAAIEN